FPLSAASELARIADVTAVMIKTIPANANPEAIDPPSLDIADVTPAILDVAVFTVDRSDEIDDFATSNAAPRFAMIVVAPINCHAANATDTARIGPGSCSNQPNAAPTDVPTAVNAGINTSDRNCVAPVTAGRNACPIAACESSHCAFMIRCEFARPSCVFAKSPTAAPAPWNVSV